MDEKHGAEVVWICPMRRVRAWATLERNVKECCIETEARAHSCYGCPGPIKYARTDNSELDKALAIIAHYRDELATLREHTEDDDHGWDVPGCITEIEAEVEAMVEGK